MPKTVQEINEKIRKGQAVVVTAEEIIDIVDEKGTKKAAEELRSRTLGWGFRIIDFLKTDPKLNAKQKTFVDSVDINQVRTGTVDSLSGHITDQQAARHMGKIGERKPEKAKENHCNMLPGSNKR